jgi:hypothetical protein
MHGERGRLVIDGVPDKVFNLVPTGFPFSSNLSTFLHQSAKMTRISPIFLTVASLWYAVASAPLSEWMNGQVANFGGQLTGPLHWILNF